MADPERDWSDARAKIEAEGRCRVCGRDDADLRALGRPAHERVEAAHVIGRAYDGPHPDGRPGRWVNPDDVVPLCTEDHRDYDAHRLNLAPYLKPVEYVRATRLVGHGPAERRIMGAAWREVVWEGSTR